MAGTTPGVEKERNSTDVVQVSATRYCKEFQLCGRSPRHWQGASQRKTDPRRSVRTRLRFPLPPLHPARPPYPGRCSLFSTHSLRRYSSPFPRHVLLLAVAHLFVEIPPTAPALRAAAGGKHRRRRRVRDVVPTRSRCPRRRLVLRDGPRRSRGAAPGAAPRGRARRVRLWNCRPELLADKLRRVYCRRRYLGRGESIRVLAQQ